VQQLVNIESVSGNESDIADFVQNFLQKLDYLTVSRIGNSVIAQTHLGRTKRIALAGHLDTVPISTLTNNHPSYSKTVNGQEVIWGRGSVDMKAGDAVFLQLLANFATDPENLKYDITSLFYENEEVVADLNGLNIISQTHPELLQADFAILGEPTNSIVEAGCNGTIRFDINFSGKAAHSARAWVGDNAIHKTQYVLEILNHWNQSEHCEEVEGLVYREGLNATLSSGGIGTNIIPDRATLHINYRFAPNKSLEQAQDYLTGLFSGYELIWRNLSPSARPGTNLAEVQEFATLVKQITQKDVQPKFGWTDVARFSSIGVPALNFGPGNPLLAHTDDEQVATDDVLQAYNILLKYFSIT
jgi:succinyl-diaminopimelate desuccinylase